MAQNAPAFEAYLKQQGIVLDKNTHEDNTVFVVPETVDAVGPVSLMVLFNDSDRYVTLICFKYFAFPAEKRPAVLEMVNTLNAEYTMVKFVETGNAVSAQVVVPFHDNFSSEVVVDMIALVFRAMQEEHPRLLNVLQ